MLPDRKILVGRAVEIVCVAVEPRHHGFWATSLAVEHMVDGDSMGPGASARAAHAARDLRRAPVTFRPRHPAHLRRLACGHA
jgi:hypothetical protein